MSGRQIRHSLDDQGHSVGRRPRHRRRRIIGIGAVTTALLLAVGLLAALVNRSGGPTAHVQPATQQLARNGSFTDGLNGWRIQAPGRLSLIRSGRTDGSAVRLTTSSTSTIALNDTTNTVDGTAAGAAFRVSAWVRTVTPNVSTQLRVREVKSGALVGQGTAEVWLRDTAWHQLSFDYAAKAVGSSLDLNVVVWDLAPNKSLDVDDVSMLAVTGGVQPVPSASGRPAPKPSASGVQPKPKPSRPSAGCTLNAKLVPSCGALWGMYTTGAASDWVSPFTALEKGTGRQFDIVKRYHDWSNAGANGQFPDASERQLGAGGQRILFFAWVSNVYSSKTHVMWKDIAAGKYDASVIRPEAARLKAWKLPVFLGFDHEMDGTTRTGDGSAADYVAAYRHIHDVLARAGATNVVWVWNPTGYLGNESKIAAMYPGNGYVDWIAYDPYNFYLCHNSTWKSPQATLDPFYQWLMARNLGSKPFMLAEFGTSFDPNNANAMGDWYAGVSAAMKSLPNLKAAVLFNSGNGKQFCDYRITTNSHAMQGYAASGRSAYVAAAKDAAI